MAEKKKPKNNGNLTVKKNQSPKKRGGYYEGNEYNLPNMELKKLDEDESKRGFIEKTVRNVLVFHEIGKNPVKTVDELCDRLNLFFNLCADTQQIPTYEKMCIALGKSRKTIYDWETAKTNGVGLGTQEIILRAKDMLATMDADLLLEGKVNPVAYIFRAKNFYGMKDKVDYNIETEGGVKAEQSVESLAKRYKDVPFDDVEVIDVD